MQPGTQACGLVPPTLMLITSQLNLSRKAFMGRLRDVFLSWFEFGQVDSEHGFSLNSVAVIETTTNLVRKGVILSAIFKL